MSVKKWAIDPSHSEIQFKVKHLMITTVTGYFREFSGSAESDGNNFDNASIAFEANTASIDTNSTDRDKHLKSEDFFHADKFPSLNFKSKKMEKTGDNTFTLHGDMTIKDVTHPLSLDVEMGGVMKDPWGNEKAGFSLSGKINRKDWGLNWNAALESGGFLVSDEVRLYCEVQLAEQA